MCLQVITNLPEDHVESVHALDFPGRGDAGYAVPFSKVVYIEATDFKVKDEKDYFGLAPGKAIMLRCALPNWCFVSISLRCKKTLALLLARPSCFGAPSRIGVL